jgi:N-acyl-D-aspartate/D-glutamate deacylase
VVVGLGDAGAHVGQVIDASQATFLLSYWVRERQAFTLEDAVRRITSSTASLFGIADRGVLVEGAHADVNVFDADALDLELPEYVRDLPGEAGRLVQRARGYHWTIVNGEVTVTDGEHTGARAGTVLRSAG